MVLFSNQLIDVSYTVKTIPMTRQEANALKLKLTDSAKNVMLLYNVKLNDGNILSNDETFILGSASQISLVNSFFVYPYVELRRFRLFRSNSR